MLFYTLGIFSVAIFGFCGAQEITLPSSCHRNGTDYSVCLKHAIKESWPIFMAGLPEYNFPTLDPFFFEYHRHVYNGLLLRANIVVANTTLSGVSNAYFTSVKPYFDKETFRIEVDMRIPEVFCEGDTEVNGTLLLVKLTGKGHYNITVENVRTRWIIIGQVANDRWTIQHLFINPTPKTMKIYLNGFNKNSREFNEAVTNIVNDNWKKLYQTILPVARKAWDTWLTEYCNRFFSKVSLSKLFP